MNGCIVTANKSIGSVHLDLIPRPVHGLVFLYKWLPGEEPQGSIVADSRLEEIFFAKQVNMERGKGEGGCFFPV